MINHIRLALSVREFEALVELANDELRSPADQARMILRLELERRGLLKPQPNGSVVLLEAIFRAKGGEGGQR